MAKRRASPRKISNVKAGKKTKKKGGPGAKLDGVSVHSAKTPVSGAAGPPPGRQPSPRFPRAGLKLPPEFIQDAPSVGGEPIPPNTKTTTQYGLKRAQAWKAGSPRAGRSSRGGAVAGSKSTESLKRGNLAEGDQFCGDSVASGEGVLAD